MLRRSPPISLSPSPCAMYNVSSKLIRDILCLYNLVPLPPYLASTLPPLVNFACRPNAVSICRYWLQRIHAPSDFSSAIVICDVKVGVRVEPGCLLA